MIPFPIPSDLIWQGLIPLDLLPLDIPTNGSREATPLSVLPLLLIVLLALVAMVAILFFIRRRRGKQ